MNTFYTCWVENTNGGYGHKHPSREVAQAEAKRLAALPHCIGFAVINRVTWVDMEPELQIPF